MIVINYAVSKYSSHDGCPDWLQGTWRTESFVLIKVAPVVLGLLWEPAGKRRN